MVVEANDLLRRILQIVIHCDDEVAARVTETGHYGVVLAIVAGMLDI